jgi:chloride channel protein, CIC family
MDVRLLWAKWRPLRQRVRNDELFLVLLAIISGAAAAAGVIALRGTVVVMHHYLYQVPLQEHALGQATLKWWQPLAVLGLGGVVYGLVAHAIRRWRKQEPLDVIEANALHGGMMSFPDGVIIALMTVGSVGLGASVGLEAGVTQLGAAASSWLGQRCGISRSSLRTMVGCGAAAAIAAAFNAPIAGTFYALELVIGGYAVTALVPVAVAAITGTLTAHLIFDVDPIYYIVTPPMLNSADYGLFALLGLAAAGVGVGVMRAATTFEGLLRVAAIPAWLRPAMGGVLVAAIGYFYPQALGTGHGAIDVTLKDNVPVELVLLLLAAKALASAISIGSGFRGGLFSASLLLGGLLGTVYWNICFHFFPTQIAVHSAYAVVGIGAVAAAVVGAPLTMILLVFEITSDYTMTIGVAVAVMVATVVTRRWFGYSFATWRFHLRGVGLKGAYDVGRMYELTVRRVLDRDMFRVPATMKLDALVSEFAKQRQSLAFVHREDGTFVGTIEAQSANAKIAELGKGSEVTAENIAQPQTRLLTPADRLSTTLSVLDETEHEAAAVVMSPTDPRLVGCVHKADLLRCYVEEADQMRREELGAVGLFAEDSRPR